MTTTERLHRLGYDHIPGDHGKKHITRDGVIVLRNVNVFEANEWLEKIERKADEQLPLRGVTV